MIELRFTIAQELLRVELERLERDHYSGRSDALCDGCLRAFATRLELADLARAIAALAQP